MLPIITSLLPLMHVNRLQPPEYSSRHSRPHTKPSRKLVSDMRLLRSNGQNSSSWCLNRSSLGSHQQECLALIFPRPPVDSKPRQVELPRQRFGASAGATRNCRLRAEAWPQDNISHHCTPARANRRSLPSRCVRGARTIRAAWRDS